MISLETRKQKADRILNLLANAPSLSTPVNFTDFYSEGNVHEDGTLFSLSEHPEWKEKIKALEEEYGIYIYHVYHYSAPYGEILDCLYLPEDEEDYSCIVDFLDRQSGVPYTVVPIYTINLTRPDFSEFGSGGYKEGFNGISKVV